MHVYLSHFSNANIVVKKKQEKETFTTNTYNTRPKQDEIKGLFFVRATLKHNPIVDVTHVKKRKGE